MFVPLLRARLKTKQSDTVKRRATSRRAEFGTLVHSVAVRNDVTTAPSDPVQFSLSD